MGIAQVVPLASGAAGPCFFLVPGTGGKIDGFVNLAPHLRIPIPAYTIAARGLDDSSMPDTDVAEMARHYVAQLRTVQAAGPYFLLGHSFGGLVALEMAQLLIDTGDAIACLIMLDTPTPEKYWLLPFYLKSRGTKLRRYLTKIFAMSLRDNVAAVRRKFFAGAIDLRTMRPEVMIGGNVARVLLAHSIARERYRLRYYADRVFYFRPLEQPAGYERLWRDHVRELQISAVAGDHLSMVEPPHAALLAADLSALINRILAETPGPVRPGPAAPG
jgi:thioesterase domain-containing protein